MKKRIVLLLAVSMSCPALGFAADAEPKGGKVDAAGSTVKSSKSNSSERAGAAGTDAAATTVKGSKSNSSERTGGAAADSATTVKSGKSNSND
jgi:hypothetical protein